MSVCILICLRLLMYFTVRRALWIQTLIIIIFMHTEIDTFFANIKVTFDLKYFRFWNICIFLGVEDGSGRLMWLNIGLLTVDVVCILILFLFKSLSCFMLSHFQFKLNNFFFILIFLKLLLLKNCFIYLSHLLKFHFLLFHILLKKLSFFKTQCLIMILYFFKL